MVCLEPPTAVVSGSATNCKGPWNADTFYCIVDLHAITMPHQPQDLLEATRRCVYAMCMFSSSTSSCPCIQLTSCMPQVSGAVHRVWSGP